MRDAFHFVLAVDFRVDAHALAVLGKNPARVAEVNSPHQLAHDEQVRAAHQLGLQRRKTCQRVVHLRRTKVHVEAHSLTKLKQALLGAHFRPFVVPLWTANCAEQNRVRAIADSDSFGGKGNRGGLDRTSTDESGLKKEGRAPNFINHFESFDGFGHDFGTNPIARQNRDSKQTLHYLQYS